MVQLTKSMPIVKERTCTASMVLDMRTNRKNVSEFPLAVRFTIGRKLFYYKVGGSYTEKKFSDICNASKSASDNYRIQKEWRSRNCYCFYTGSKNKLDESTKKTDAFTKAIDSFIAKVKDIKFKAKVDDADMEQAINNRKKLIENESKFLEDHRKANKEIFTRHFYDMSNMMSRNEGVWLSNGWVKVFLWIFLPCFLYTVISIVYFVASYIDK